MYLRGAKMLKRSCQWILIELYVSLVICVVCLLDVGKQKQTAVFGACSENVRFCWSCTIAEVRLTVWIHNGRLSSTQLHRTWWKHQPHSWMRANGCKKKPYEGEGELTEENVKKKSALWGKERVAKSACTQNYQRSWVQNLKMFDQMVYSILVISCS